MSGVCLQGERRRDGAPCNQEVDEVSSVVDEWGVFAGRERG